MAKLIKSYENGVEKFELTFCGKTYDYSMLPTTCGRKGDKPAFDTQVEREMADVPEPVLELLDAISWEDSGSDLLGIMKKLDRYEKRRDGEE